MCVQVQNLASQRVAAISLSCSYLYDELVSRFIRLLSILKDWCGRDNPNESQVAKLQVVEPQAMPARISNWIQDLYRKIPPQLLPPMRNLLQQAAGDFQVQNHSAHTSSALTTGRRQSFADDA